MRTACDILEPTVSVSVLFRVEFSKLIVGDSMYDPILSSVAYTHSILSR